MIKDILLFKVNTIDDLLLSMSAYALLACWAVGIKEIISYLFS